MIAGMIGTGIGAAITGYGNLIGMFGSPVMQIAIAAALIAAAMVELYVRNRKHAEEAV